MVLLRSHPPTRWLAPPSQPEREICAAAQRPRNPCLLEKPVSGPADNRAYRAMEVVRLWCLGASEVGTCFDVHVHLASHDTRNGRIGARASCGPSRYEQLRLMH